ncbi:hypothetical protein PYCCODRAFT_1401530 [Trametes coccinea BRFM310]|uniref:DUF6535 domain-containing protein n=1 Tax=Trametes coccinea (strain BRFM310) TaxID=1353009 RepID=A0A1Y2J8I8_TRAC3|nr:hypothetical protein PYCCODRAFT_1401530 [Trametes coccinea BRFM310]
MNRAHTTYRSSRAEGDGPLWESSEAWAACAKALREYDEDMVQAWKEEIDTLLVFAGLFSAVLTAFNIESYKLLQQQPEDATVAILAQISAQLNSYATNANFANTTRPTSPASLAPPFETSALAVRLNTLWFSALVCSLLSASLGLLVKQWLREYLAGSSNVSRESIRIRQYRYEGLRRWRVPEIILFLPMLLQLSLVLFFIGLVDLLWSLHPVVATVVSVIAATGGVLGLTTSILPPLCPDCPYKSPQSWLLCILVQSFKGALSAIASRYYWHLQHSDHEGDLWASKLDLPTIVHNRVTGAFRAWLYRRSLGDRPYSSWKEREKAHVSRAAASLDDATLAGADRTFMDDAFLGGVVRPCMNDIEPHSALRCLERILLQRAPRVIYGLPYWEHAIDAGDKGAVTLMHLLLDLLHRLNQEPDDHDHEQDEARRQILMTMHRLVRSVPGQSSSLPSDSSTHILLGRTFDVLAGVIDREHERAPASPVIRERAFHLMLKLFPRFQAVGPTCILTFCTYSKRMREDNSPYRFMQACIMVIRASALLASAPPIVKGPSSAPAVAVEPSLRQTNSTESAYADEYVSVRPAVQALISDLEDFFSIPVSRAADCRPTMAMLAECAEAVLALAARDQLAISPGLVQALTDMFNFMRGVGRDSSEDSVEDHALTARQAIRLLRRVYGVELGWRPS